MIIRRITLLLLIIIIILIRLIIATLQGVSPCQKLAFQGTSITTRSARGAGRCAEIITIKLLLLLLLLLLLSLLLLLLLLLLLTVNNDNTDANTNNDTDTNNIRTLGEVTCERQESLQHIADYSVDVEI